MRTILLLMLVAPTLKCLAQPGGLSDEMKNRFPDHSVVFLERSMTINIDLEGDSLRAYSDIHEDMLHLKNQTDGYANRRVYGSSFEQIDKLQAKTLVWEKNRYREIPVTDLIKNSKPDQQVFYDDSYYYSFNYPSVAAGNRTQLDYREILKDVRFISGYIVSSYLPQARATFTVKTTSDVGLEYRVINDPEKKIRFTRTEKGRNVTYQWVAENVPPMRIEEKSPSIRYYEPHIVCYVKSYRTKSGVVNVLPDLNALHKWYTSFTSGLDEPDPPELVSVINSIKAKSRNELEIVKNIFYWVQQNIHYIAFEEGMRGFIPHKASYTCEKRYGDCKDMATIIVAMLKIAGLKGYQTWIGTRDIPYRYSEYPVPLVDNHMIATYISPEGRYYFLDATGQYTPFGFPTSMIQGKEALISFDNTRFEVREVPAVSPDDNLVTDSVVVRLENNVLAGHGMVSMHGLAKASVGHEFEHVEEKQTRDFLTRILEKGSNKFSLDHYTVSDQLDPDKPTRVAYQFRLSDYVQILGNELYVNLNLTKDNYNRMISEETRKTPHEFDFMYTKSEFIEFEIPEGYEVEYIPANDSFDGTLLDYNITYELTPGKILFRKDYSVHYLLLMPAQFRTWNEEVGRISNAYRETIILKKKNQ